MTNKTKLFLLPPALALSTLLPSHGETAYSLQRSFFSPSTLPQQDALQGYSVAVDGPIAAVGAPADNTTGFDSGVLKIYNITSGQLLHVLANPQAGEGDYFGRAVAISGSRVVVGQLNTETDGDDPGRVWVFDLAGSNPTTPVRVLNNPTPADDDWFGYSVSISGSMVVVGDFADDTGALHAGSAYVFDLDSPTPGTPIVTLHNPTPAANEHFGRCVAISDSNVLVGTDCDLGNTGSVYLYNLNNSDPTISTRTFVSPQASVADAFGGAVAISGTRLVIGARMDDSGAADSGRAYAFDLTAPNPATPTTILTNPSPAADSQFGTSVAISGSMAVVGCPQHDEAEVDEGRAYAFDLSSATPLTPVGNFENPGFSNIADRFGDAVAVSGTRIVVGAPQDDYNNDWTDAGSAYAFDLSSPFPSSPVATLNTPSRADNDHFGNAVAVSGSIVAIGAPDENRGAPQAGVVYIFDNASETPEQPIAILTSQIPGDNAGFGKSVGVSGSLIVVGEPGHGAFRQGRAYVYDLSSAAPVIPIATLNNPSPDIDDNFGAAVAISNSLVIVGASADDMTATDAGRAYVFDMSDPDPTTPKHTLENPDPANGENFGAAVAIASQRLVVSAPYHAASGNKVGKAYLFDLNSAAPATPAFAFDNPTPAHQDEFGRAVAISGGLVAVSAPRDTTVAPIGGAVYVYNTQSATPLTPAHITYGPPGYPLGTEYGHDIEISGNTLVVGASAANATEGSVYVYDLASPSPAGAIAVLTDPTPIPNSSFGNAVAISGSKLIVGAWLDDTTAFNQGAVHVLDPIPAGLASWKQLRLGDPNAPDLGDPDRDGLANLLEYGLQLIPTVADPSPLAPAAFHYAEGNRLRLFLPRDPARNDVTILVEAAGNLTGPWTTVASSVNGAPFTGAGYVSGDSATPGIKTVEIRDIMNFTDATRRFMRVKVSH